MNKKKYRTLSLFPFLLHDNTTTPTGRRLCIDPQQLHFKQQIRIRRNDSIPCPFFPVSQITGNVQNGLSSQTHQGDAFIPTANDFARSNVKRKGLSAIVGTIKLFVIRFQCASLWERREMRFVTEERDS